MSRWASVRAPLYRSRRLLCQYASVEANVGNGVLRLRCGRLARMADACVEAEFGDTAVLVTTVGKQRSSVGSFMPLTVDYKNRASAYGRIPSNFLRRELGATEAEVLTSRLIDRSIRPCFTRDCYSDCQVLCTLMAHDGRNDADALAINGASASLLCSPLPWRGPVAAVRIASGVGDQPPIVNPTNDQLLSSSFNLILTSNGQDGIIMLEGAGSAISREALIDCVEAGVVACKPIIDAMKRLQKSVGKEKRPTTSVDHSQMTAAIDQLARSQLMDVFKECELDKVAVDQRIAAIKQELSGQWSDVDAFDQCFTDVVRNVLRDYVFETGRRRDGRQLDELRPIECLTDMYPPLHGSALFQRGQSQVMCTVTLDSKQAAFKGDIGSAFDGTTKEKRFMLQYTFSPFATNEIATGRSVNRREMGHGALAEKALKSVVPEDFPFTVRLTADVLESNGSTSMATVCAASMALMDAGVPIKAQVAGVAIGLMTTESGQRILTDITGMEDYFGDMDFKIASCDAGVTAMQMDTKLPLGIDGATFSEALERGLLANRRILKTMEACIAAPRGEPKANGPAEFTVKVEPSKRAKFVGPGGIHLKRIEARTGAQIEQLDESHYSVFVSNGEQVEAVRRAVDQLLVDDYADRLEFGSICTVRIVELLDAGVVVTLHSSLPTVFIPNSQLDTRRVSRSSNLGLQVGQEICVKYFGRDPVTGQLRFSRKVLMQTESPIRLNLLEEEEEEEEEKSKQRKSPWRRTSNS